jgi:outer membrane protein
MHTPLAPLLAALLAASLAAPALAQSAGQIIVKVGINTIDPQVKSGDLGAPALPGTKIDVRPATSIILTGTYMVTDQVSVEAFAGLPYEHDIVGDGAIAGVGKIGSTKQVSPTVFAQYRFGAPADPWRPYLGLGPTYAKFYGSQGSGRLTALTSPGGPATRISTDAAWGASAQLGLNFKLTPQWSLDATVIKTWLKTTSHLSSGQSIDVRLDPLSYSLSVAYRY